MGIKRYLNSTSVLYVFFAIMFAIVFFAINPSFRDVEIPVIQKILHPEYYNGEFFSIDLVSYNPYFNYDYIVASVARWFGYEDNLWALGRIFWFLENGFTIFALIRLCNYIFNNDKTILAIAITVFLSLISNEATQDSIAMPLYIFAIYYFLKERWFVSSILGASLFYFHIGRATWWFLTSCIALFVIFLVQKRLFLRDVIIYMSTVLLIASPIICVYMVRAVNSNVDDSTIKYFYYIGVNATSPLVTLIVTPVYFTVQWLILAIYLLGYNKAKKTGYKNSNITPLVIGSVALYFIQFVFADIVGVNSVITMQLTRSVVTIYIFGMLFLAFLLTSQIKKGNFIFFLMFLFVLFIFRRGVTFVVFGSIFATYVFFEVPILHFVERTYADIKSNLDVEFLKKAINKGCRLLQHPVVIASVLLVLFTVQKFSIASPIKSYIKSALNISSSVDANTERAKKEAYNDIFGFINEKITDNRTVFLFPFLKWEFPVYSHHNSFISCFTPTYNLVCNNWPSHKFWYIFENDLHYSLERFFEDWGKNFLGKWDEMWRNLDEDIINHWKEKYNLTHVIREKELPLNFPIVYQNQFYVVYEIK